MDITIELTISVNSYEQAQAIYDAQQSGLLETVIKDRVLFGGTPTPIASERSSAAAERKAREKEIVLHSVETKRPSGTPKVVAEPPNERPRGIMGRGRINRSGRG